MSRDALNLEQLLARVAEAKPEGDRVSLDAMADAVGRRSCGSLLLLAGLIVLSPIGDVPGTPTGARRTVVICPEI